MFWKIKLLQKGIVLREAGTILFSVVYYYVYIMGMGSCTFVNERRRKKNEEEK